MENTLGMKNKAKAQSFRRNWNKNFHAFSNVPASVLNKGILFPSSISSTLILAWKVDFKFNGDNLRETKFQSTINATRACSREEKNVENKIKLFDFSKS